MAVTTYVSPVYTFSIDDLTGSASGFTYAADASILDTSGAVVAPFVDKAGDVLYAIDNEFGFYVTDFVGAEPKVFDGDYAEGFAGNIIGVDGQTVGLALRNAETDLFNSGAPLGTWSLGLGGTTVKASTEHYTTMVDVLSDQAFPGDPDALRPLDNDLRLLDLRPAADGSFEIGALHQLYAAELSQALNLAIANTASDATYTDIDFDRDGVLDTYSTVATEVLTDSDGDGTVETLLVGGVDLDADGTADIVDSFLNGYGTEADLVDLLQPNESSVTYDIAYGADYSITLKDDGKLLYRWGEAVKRPNDIRLQVDMDLPEEWTRDADGNGLADSLEEGAPGFTITKAELVITHDITNNPNDQVRPEDYENEAAIGRRPSHYIVEDPDDPSNTLWVSPVDSFTGAGDALPSYFILGPDGTPDLTVGGTAVYTPDGRLVGYRNEDAGGAPIGTVLRDASLVPLVEAAGLDFTSSDLAAGFTVEWYTSTDREPFEWSYDAFADDPYINVYESFRDPDLAAAEGYTEDELVSGPRWRLTPNKFGQDLPGLEVPLDPNSEPPFQRDNVKYETGELTTTTLNLLDWGGDSPFGNSMGWMTVDPGRLDENGDGVIDEGWSAVNGSLGAGDELPVGPILTAVTPNGVRLDSDTFDASIYVKGDRQDAAKLYDMELVIEYETTLPADRLIGAVQRIDAIDHNELTVAFQDGASFDNPVIFALPTTYNGRQAITVEFSEITSDGATMRLHEPDYLDGGHALEAVSMVTFEEGVWTLADGSLLQVGTTEFTDGATNRFHDVEFEQAFDEAPVIMLQVQTDNGPQWEVVRTDDVTTTGFRYMIQEQEASDGLHVGETVGWAAFDASAADGLVDWSGLTAQAFDTGETVDHIPDSFTFSSELGADPLIAASIASYNGSNTAILRIAETGLDGAAATADFFAQEEQSLDIEVAHTDEQVTGIAFSGSGLLTGFDADLALV